MAAQNNDDLARLLSGMANGEYSDEHSQPPADPDSIEQPPPAPAAPARPSPKPQPPAAAKPRPAAAPNPGAPAARKPVTLAPAVIKPRVVPAAAKPAAPAQSPEPAPAVEEVPAEMEGEAIPEPAPEEDVQVQSEPLDEDDAVIVPPPPVSALAHAPQRHKPAYAPRQSFLQSVAFQQTLIPISFSLGLVCLVYLAIGLASPKESPFAAFMHSFIPYLLGLIGFVMLAVGVVTMLMVKNRLDRQAASGQFKSR